MMASNLLSRLLPPSVGSPSIYEALRKHDESADSDVEDRAGTSVDEENLGGGFQDYELDHAEEEGIEDSQMTNESTASLLRRDLEQATRQDEAVSTDPRWMASPDALQDAMAEAEDGDDEVPASLLVEGNGIPLPSMETQGQMQSGRLPKSQAIPGSLTREARAQWNTTQGQQPLYQDDRLAETERRPLPISNIPFGMISRQDRAEWRWANVQNLDNFLKEVYEYFLMNGFRSILLSRMLNLLTLAFVVGFTIFLSMCVDYGKIPRSKSMSQVLVPQCTKNMSSSINILLWLFTFFWIGKAFQHMVDIRRLRQVHDFYLYLLNIPDSELQTISWQEIVARLMALRDKNPITANGIDPKHRRFVLGTQSKQRMDAQDIANRLMRKENYLIALFNKEILDLRLPVPFLRNRQLFSKALEWNLSFCILDYVFNEDGQVKALFTKATHRRMLSDGLRDRFKFAGFMNIICAPFIVAYCVVHYFFRYFNEYQHNPSQLGSRQYTPLAEWKFREFNELWHLFQRRINMSYPFASRYVDQFPKDKTIQISRFVAFVAGALASVLALASVIDPELFLGFEITPERTVLFYLGVFGTIWAVARGAVPEENLVFDPEYALREVIEYTHYLPNEWRGRLHSDGVKREFSTLYQMKIVTFLEEIFCLILTPFILWFALPKCSDRIVDFFREFTIEVDGLGRICSFAEFDFKKAGDNVAQQRPQQDDSGRGLREDYYATKDGKMLASYFGFLDNYSTNPRPNAPYMYPSNKRMFQQPPSYNIPVSPEFGADHGPGRQSRPGRPSPIQRGIGRSQGVSASMRRGSRILPGAVQASPMPSMLLDPHHQPSASGFRSGSRLGTQSRYRGAGPNILDETIQDEDELDEVRLAEMGGPNSTGDDGLGVEDSLGDSWRTTRGATRDDEDREDENRRRGEEGDNGAGVLGLLYQFQKAQTGTRAGGVNI